MNRLTPTPFPRDPEPIEHPAARRRYPHVPVWVLIAIAALLAAAAVPLALAVGNDNATQTDSATRSSQVVQAAAPVVVTVDDLCKLQNELSTQLHARGACQQAADARAAINQAPASIVAAAPGLTAEQVQQRITDALAGLPRPLTIDQVAAKAQEVYAAASTPERLAAAVTAFCANDACRGPKGDDAPPAPDSQILAQVNAYCAAREDKCVGPEGPQGKQGVQGLSFQRQYFARDGSGDCLSYVESLDPATGVTATASSPAGDAACTSPPPSATPSPGLLSGG